VGWADETRESRDREGRARDALDRLAPALSDGPRDFVCLTYAPYGTAYPTAVGSTFALKPQRIAGDETAGISPTFTDDPAAAVILAVCLGPAAPAVGAYVLVSTSPEGRWVFQS
jgi:hypothetical protein